MQRVSSKKQEPYEFLRIHCIGLQLEGHGQELRALHWYYKTEKKTRRNPVDTDSWNRLQYWLIPSHIGWDSQDAVFKAGTLWLRETTPKENPGPPVWRLGVRPAIARGIFTKRSETFLSRYTHCITTTRSKEYISQRNCPPPAVRDS